MHGRLHLPHSLTIFHRLLRYTTYLNRTYHNFDASYCPCVIIVSGECEHTSWWEPKEKKKRKLLSVGESRLLDKFDRKMRFAAVRLHYSVNDSTAFYQKKLLASVVIGQLSASIFCISSHGSLKNMERVSCIWLEDVALWWLSVVLRWGRKVWDHIPLCRVWGIKTGGFRVNKVCSWRFSEVRKSSIGRFPCPW